MKYKQYPNYQTCHAPNPIPGFVTMTGMLISSLNLILTRTNLIFTKILPKLPSYFSFLFPYLNNITFYLTFRASTLYSKDNIIHQLFKFGISHNTSQSLSLRIKEVLIPPQRGSHKYKIHSSDNMMY